MHNNGKYLQNEKRLKYVHLYRKFKSICLHHHRCHAKTSASHTPKRGKIHLTHKHIFQFAFFVLNELQQAPNSSVYWRIDNDSTVDK